jgi:DNA-binding NarL/FixJ family response regulator
MKIASPEIMVVDDEPHVVEFVTEMLRAINFTVYASANSGEDAIHKIQKKIPDMVILDITMPGMTGDELISRIKAISKKTKIVMLTSRNTIDMVKMCRENGADGYILKSETQIQICQKIQEIWFSGFFEGRK